MQFSFISHLNVFKKEIYKYFFSYEIVKLQLSIYQNGSDSFLSNYHKVIIHIKFLRVKYLNILTIIVKAWIANEN